LIQLDCDEQTGAYRTTRLALVKTAAANARSLHMNEFRIFDPTAFPLHGVPPEHTFKKVPRSFQERRDEPFVFS
jgi:hypothetical protein